MDQQYGGNEKRVWTSGLSDIGYTHGRASPAATSTMKSVTTLMAPHAWPGFTRSTSVNLHSIHESAVVCHLRVRVRVRVRG